MLSLNLQGVETNSSKSQRKQSNGEKNSFLSTVQHMATIRRSRHEIRPQLEMLGCALYDFMSVIAEKIVILAGGAPQAPNYSVSTWWSVYTPQTRKVVLYYSTT